MSRTALLLVVAAVLGFAVASARAGDGKSVEERLAGVEQRLEAVETWMRSLREQVEPALQRSRLAANEVAAMATLRNVISAQAQFQQSAKADEDNDGTGEYGGFLELSGAVAGRMGEVLNPPVLSGRFRKLVPEGVVVGLGYCYRMFLPGKGGVGVGEPQGGFSAAAKLDPELGEVAFVCYAWPEKQGETGSRTFFINQEGDILVTADSNYSGPASGPAADAAFRGHAKIVGATAANSTGADGNTWKLIN
jgi:hypothetical protein